MLEEPASPVDEAEGVKAYHTVAFGNELLRCACTFRGRLTLSYGCCASDVEEGVAEGIMDRLAGELRGFAGCRPGGR